MDLYSAECFKNSIATAMNENLLVTPYTHNPMLVKLTCNGVTVLKEGVFRSRLTGSRSHTLLPNAELISNDLLRKLQPAKVAAATKRLPAPGKKIDKDQSLSPSQREYRVNKKLIRQRVYSYLLGQHKPILHAITVSFPPCMDDDLAYQALNTWLTTCRQSLHLREYLFVAERQEIGTIHYHLLIPQYFNIEKANKAMAVTLANFVRKGQLNWNIYAAKRYNGVHISKNNKTKRVTNFALGGNSRALSNYITKYISKNDQPFRHYAWHNSRGFSAVMTGISLTEAEAKFYGIRGQLNMDRIFTSEYATFVGWMNSPAAPFIEAMRFVNGIILNKGKPELSLHKKLFLQLPN